MLRQRIIKLWVTFWMRFGGMSRLGRYAYRFAGWVYPTYKALHGLAKLSDVGYVSPSATINISNLTLGKNLFIGDGVIIFARSANESVIIGNDVYINKDTIIELGHSGELVIGNSTTIQPRCQFSAYVSKISIGDDVQIAPNCAFYPYNHQILPDKPIKNQPLVSKGGITIEDDVWIGYGVVVLDGVYIEKGAVIGAGSVVNCNIPAGAIAAGVPARILKYRDDLQIND